MGKIKRFLNCKDRSSEWKSVDLGKEKEDKNNKEEVQIAQPIAETNIECIV